MQIQEDIETSIRRSKLCIIASILEEADGKKKETQIMYKSGCNSKQFKGYKKDLLACHLLERNDGTVKRTGKGDEYLEGYIPMMNLLKNGDSASKQPSYRQNGNGYTINKVSD